MMEENRPSSTSIEPFAILLTANSAQAETLTKKCAYLFEQSSEDPVEICYLNGSRSIQRMVEAAEKKSFDVLVCSVFCFAAVLEQIPDIINSNRLNYVHFHRIDDMWQIEPKITQDIVQTVFSRNSVPQVSHRVSHLFCTHFIFMYPFFSFSTQTMVTSGTHCVILHFIFANSLNPLLVISKHAIFEAAIYANTYFIATLEDKYKDLVGRLNWTFVIVQKKKKVRR